MNKKLSYIICSYLVCTIVLSCDDDFGHVGCGDTQFDYVHSGVTAQNVIRKTHSKGESVTITNNDTVSLDTNENVGFSCGFHDSTTKVTSLCSRQSAGSVVSKAYATPPTLLVYVLTDTFESLSIITINDFDSSHEANSEITEYFTYGRGPNYGSSNEPMDSIVDYLNGLGDEWYTSETSVMLVLQETPTMDQELKFEIIATYTSGKSLSVTTKPVFLMP